MRRVLMVISMLTALVCSPTMAAELQASLKAVDGPTAGPIMASLTRVPLPKNISPMPHLVAQSCSATCDDSSYSNSCSGNESCDCSCSRTPVCQCR